MTVDDINSDASDQIDQGVRRSSLNALVPWFSLAAASSLFSKSPKTSSQSVGNENSGSPRKRGPKRFKVSRWIIPAVVVPYVSDMMAQRRRQR
ncbi:hypothetical protein [Rhizobium leguminosarum]